MNEKSPSYVFDLKEFTNVNALRLLKLVVGQYKGGEIVYLLAIIETCIQRLEKGDPLLIDEASQYRYICFFAQNCAPQSAILVDHGIEAAILQKADEFCHGGKFVFRQKSDPKPQATPSTPWKSGLLKGLLPQDSGSKVLGAVSLQPAQTRTLGSPSSPAQTRALDLPPPQPSTPLAQTRVFE